MTDDEKAKIILCGGCETCKYHSDVRCFNIVNIEENFLKEYTLDKWKAGLIETEQIHINTFGKKISALLPKEGWCERWSKK